MLINKLKRTAPPLAGVARSKAIVLKGWADYAKDKTNAHVQMWVWRYPTLTDATNLTNGVLIDKTVDNKYRDENDDGSPLAINQTAYYRTQSEDKWRNLSYFSAILQITFTGTDVNELVGTIGSAQISDGAITSAKISDGAVSDTKIADGAVLAAKIADGVIGTAKFASTIKAVEIVSTLPTTGNVTGRMVFLTTDNKLYRYNGTAFVASVAAADVSGTLTDAQIAALDAAKLTGTLNVSRIAAGALDATKFASAIKAVEIFSALPTTGNVAGRMVFLTTDNKLYRYNGTAFVSSVATSDLTGTITDAQLAGIAASKVTGTLTNSQIADLAAAKLTGQITGTQITDGAVVTAKLAAGAVTANEIAASTITAAKIAAGTITATEIAGGTITGAKIAAGTVQASNIAAGTITGDRIAGTTITADKLVANSITAGQIAAATITATELAADSVTAKQLLLTDFSNIVDNGWSQGNLSGWGVAGQLGFTLDTTAGDANGWRLESNERDNAYSTWIAVTPGETFFFDAWVKNNLAASMALLYMNCGDANKGSLTWLAAASTTTIGTWTRLQGQVVVPAGKYFIRMGMSNTRTAGSGGASIFWTKPIMRRANSAELIVDGAVTANKIAAGTITAAQIAADTITGAKIAATTITAANIAANTITAAQIAADTITAGQIAAGAIAASELAANAVTASKIAVGTFSDNLILDGDFESGLIDMWSGPGGTLTNIADTTAPNGGRALNFDRGVTNNTVSMNRIWSNYIPVEAGDTYYAEMTIKGSAASTNGAYLRVLFYDGNKAGIGDPATSLIYRDFYSNGAITTSYVTVSSSYVIPVGTKYIRVQVYHHSTSTAQNLYVSNVTARKMLPGSLIVNGTISANQIAAGAITAAKLSVSDLSAISANLGSITVGAINLAADAVIPSKLYSADSTNMWRDPDMVDLSLWNTSCDAGTPALTRVNLASSSGSGFSKYYLKSTVTGGSPSNIKIYGGRDIMVEPNRRYYTSALIGPASGTGTATYVIITAVFCTMDSSGNVAYSSETTVASQPAMTGPISVKGYFTVPTGCTRMQLLFESYGANTTLIVTSPVLRRVEAVSGEVNTSGAFGSFNTGQQNIQDITLAHGPQAAYTMVWGYFRNTSGAARAFDVDLFVGGSSFASAPSQQVPDNGYCVIFSIHSNPTGNSSNYSLRVQCSTTGNNVSNRRLIALAVAG